MGDMADYTLSCQMNDDDWTARPFRSQGPPYRFITCKRCGKTGLKWFGTWDSDKGKRVWRLINYQSGTLHKCEKEK
jgi:hypothetical protein